MRGWRAVGAVFGVTADDRCWAPCPLFHLAAIGPLLFCVANGAAFLSDTWYRPDEALALCEAERATVLYPAYPPITQALMTAPGFSSGALGSARAMLNVAPPKTLTQM